MKKIFCLLLLVCFCSYASGIGSIVVVNGDGVRLYYNFNDDETAVLVAKPKGRPSGKVVIPASIEYESVTYPVIGIEDGAFESCGSLTEVYIPSSVKTIGSSAFKDCESLSLIQVSDEVTSIGESAFEATAITSFTIGNKIATLNSKLFYGCVSLKSIQIPDGVTQMGEFVFACSGIENVSIGSGLTTIPTGTFYACGSLKELYIPDNITSIGQDAICNSIERLTIGKGIATINEGIVSSSSSLKALTIEGNGMTVIETKVTKNNKGTTTEKGAFEGFENLETVVLGDGVKTIGNRSFSGCTALKSIKLGGITSVPNYAFSGCSALEDIDLSNVTSFGNYAFSGCSGTASLDLSRVTSIGESTFNGWTKLTLVNLSNVTTIGKGAFNNCENIESMTFSKNLQSMGLNICKNISKVFADDIATILKVMLSWDGAKGAVQHPIDYYVNDQLLTDITIPDGTTTLPTYCLFATSASTIVLPATLTSIEAYALAYATPEKVYCYATTPPTIADSYTLSTLSQAIVYIPYGTKTTYEADSNWKKVQLIELPNTEEITWETVTVSEGGGLRLALSELEATKVKHLRINGKLNATDIVLLRAREGRLSELESLDLTEVTLVPGDEPYLTVSGDDGSGTFRTASTVYYISNERSEHREVDFHSTVDYHYDYCLPMAFWKMPFKKVVLPKAFTEIGEGIFLGCTEMTEVVAPTTLTIIGSSAFSGCSALQTSPDMSQVKKMGDKAFQDCISLEASQFNISSLDSISAYAFNGCRSIGSFIFSPSLKYVGNYAFSTSGLKKLNLPATVTYIGEYAFAYCSKLHQFAWPESVPTINDCTFKGCTALTDVQLPDNLYRIGGGSFDGCTSLTSLAIPQQLCRIGRNAFRATPWYDGLPFVDGVKYAGNVAMETTASNIALREGTTGVAGGFCGEMYDQNISYNYRDKYHKQRDYPVTVTLPASLRYIGPSAFINSPLATVTIPDGVEEIEEYAFFYNLGLTSLQLPNTLKRLGHESFAYGSFPKVTIPESIEELSYRCFVNNSDLLRVEYNARAAHMESNATYHGELFADCPSLERVLIGPNVEIIPDSIFRYCKPLLKVDMGANVKEIGEDAFYQCSSLTSIELPDGLTTIGGRALSGCTGITEIQLPKSIKSIGPSAFDAVPITEIVLPAGLENFADIDVVSAFKNCTKLTKVVSYIKQPYEISLYAFEDETFRNGWLYVPVGTLSLYKSTQYWSKFKNIVEMDDNTGISGIQIDGNTNVSIYNLSGLRLAAPQKGINIVDRKKVIIK